MGGVESWGDSPEPDVPILTCAREKKVLFRDRKVEAADPVFVALQHGPAGKVDLVRGGIEVDVWRRTADGEDGACLSVVEGEDEGVDWREGEGLDVCPVCGVGVDVYRSLT